ncbi:response regulator transcription factor [Ruegeria sp. 2205SS24-7]|uniref:response regulator transcription factor n=1 Tax=Ruegeria discodermiae TaxID=3064389 RepID=UPI0027403A5F|nr:response regulator transcription factor [Ruegeria sp. 2205SS24-7]MDP5220905.1 response regulator transcription factor [Ruegeria sp. 2205SS24-7]
MTGLVAASGKKIMRILLAEDDTALAHQIWAELEDSGFTVDHVATGEDAAHFGEVEAYSAIVLDLGLPILDGVSVLRRWRAGGIATPVIILTARSGWRDKVDGLNAGGDDYLGKPFQMDELIARLRALVRRANGVPQTILTHRDIELDTIARTVRTADGLVKVTSHELKLLTILMMNPCQLHRKVDLAEGLYGYFEERDSNTVEVFVARLRKKLGADIIETERGLGYRLGEA